MATFGGAPVKIDLRDHHVDALVAIDELGDVQIGRDAGELVGIIARQMFFGDEKIDHFAHGERRADALRSSLKPMVM